VCCPLQYNIDERPWFTTRGSEQGGKGFRFDQSLGAAEASCFRWVLKIPGYLEAAKAFIWCVKDRVEGRKFGVLGHKIVGPFLHNCLFKNAKE
jgi:hypothetical protein